jgi:hypoxanthine phosphoribosyltransferase
VDTKQGSVYNAVVSELKLLIARPDIEARVARLGADITRDYRGRRPLIIGVLKGAVIFLADLVRRIELETELDFIGIASYGDGTESCGRPVITCRPKAGLTGRDIIVVEDIVDSGLCLEALLTYLKEAGPASVKVCALLDKPSRRRVSVNIDYTGFAVSDEFVVGYGLDCAQRYRNLPEIYTIKEGTDNG